jgi:hypothetical protein
MEDDLKLLSCIDEHAGGVSNLDKLVRASHLKHALDLFSDGGSRQRLSKGRVHVEALRLKVVVVGGLALELLTHAVNEKLQIANLCLIHDSLEGVDQDQRLLLAGLLLVLRDIELFALNQVVVGSQSGHDLLRQGVWSSTKT